MPQGTINAIHSPFKYISGRLEMSYGGNYDIYLYPLILVVLVVHVGSCAKKIDKPSLELRSVDVFLTLQRLRRYLQSYCRNFLRTLDS